MGGNFETVASLAAGAGSVDVLVFERDRTLRV